MILRLADRLHQPVFAIEQMTFEEFSEWLAYFNILREENK